MGASTVNISFQEELLALIDETAAEEARSRSELIREAARIYIERKGRWKAIFALGEGVVRKRKLTEAEIVAEARKARG